MSRQEKPQSNNQAYTSKVKFDPNQALEPAQFEAPETAQGARKFRFTIGHIALILMALLCATFIAFISVAKSIQITAVTPNLNKPDELLLQPAQITLHTRIKLPLGNRVLVLPGEHHVSLLADGFFETEQTLNVVADRHQQFELVMTRLPGNLDVTLPEGVTASLLIDGEPAGAIPGLVENIPAGLREITIDADLYRPFQTQILVKGKGSTQNLVAELEAAWAAYEFASNPAGANIVLDGAVVGQTPTTIKIEEGSHQLQIAAEGFKPFTQEINVVAEQNVTSPLIELIPADGVLELASQPSGAAVIINDEFKGTTPLTLALKPSEEQTLKVYRAGYLLAEEKLTLAPAQKLSQEVTLNADLIPVKVSVSPASAQVYVDGVPRGRGSQTLNLSSLPHSIRVSQAGYVTQSSDIVPTRNGSQVLTFKLLTEEQHYWAQIPPKYTNRAGHEMKLFRNLGRVSLGSSRREDGRRANEAQYQVELTKPFYVALHETTNRQFRQFRANHNAGNYKGKSLDANKAPALRVSWQQAAQYCNWLSQQEGLDPFYQTTRGFVSGVNPDANGYRLLTEAEWAWLARSSSTSRQVYPWGNTKQPPDNTKFENYADQSAAPILRFTLEGYQDGYTGPAPVGRFPANEKGLFDFTGNAAEWVHDWYSATGSSELADGVVKDPLGPDEGEFRVIRGASWARGYLPQLRLAYRDYAAKGAHDVGFRVARYAGLNKSKLNNSATGNSVAATHSGDASSGAN